MLETDRDNNAEFVILLQFQSLIFPTMRELGNVLLLALNVLHVCLQPAVQPSAPDSTADKELSDSFKKIAGDDMEIDAYELQDILNAAFAKGRQIYLILVIYCHR